MHHSVYILIFWSGCWTLSCQQPTPPLQPSSPVVVDTLPPAPVAASVDTLPPLHFASVEASLPPHYHILDQDSGDLNLDPWPDLLVAIWHDVEQQSKDGYYDDEEEDSARGYDALENEEGTPRQLMLLLGTPEGYWHQVVVAQVNLGCADCGGVLGDDFARIWIEPGLASIERFGGSTDRWVDVTRYQYQPEHRNWQLIQNQVLNYRSSEPEENSYYDRSIEDEDNVRWLGPLPGDTLIDGQLVRHALSPSSDAVAPAPYHWQKDTAAFGEKILNAFLDAVAVLQSLDEDLDVDGFEDHLVWFQPKDTLISSAGTLMVWYGNEAYDLWYGFSLPVDTLLHTLREHGPFQTLDSIWASRGLLSMRLSSASPSSNFTLTYQYRHQEQNWLLVRQQQGRAATASTVSLSDHRFPESVQWLLPRHTEAFQLSTH